MADDDNDTREALHELLGAKWEYRFAEVRDDQYDIEELNVLGDERWEIVTAARVGDSWYICLKRRVA